MNTSSRGTRCGAVVLASLTALSLAACGASTTSPTASAPSSSSSSAPAPSGKDHASGLVASVSGGTITLTGPTGTTTVDVAASTHVTQVTPGQLTNVVVGDCVVVRPTKDGGAPPTVTAASVQFGAADNGRCGHAGGWGGKAVVGTVASINGSTVAVTGADNAKDTVTVTPSTRYASRSKATPAAITVGQCLTARGTKDGSGALQAQNVSVRPADNGQCPGGEHQGG